MENIGIIVQARTNSSRLPQKVVAPFYEGESIVEILLEKLKSLGLPIVLAVPDSEKTDALEKIARGKGVYFFQGSEHDALKRFLLAAERFDIDVVIRVCADNPFLHVPYLQELINCFKKKGGDYVSYATPSGTPVIKTHYGFFGELVTVSALKRISERNQGDPFREHVTSYIYSFPDGFEIRWLEFPFKEPERGMRFTVDTEDDFKLASELFAKYKDLPPPELVDILSKDKEVLEKMERQMTLNAK